MAALGVVAALRDACTVLDGLTPGRLPQPVFNSIARLAVLPSVLLVPLFRRDGKTRVCLTRRAASEAWYPGLLHPPGTVILADDSDLGAVIDRLRAREIPHLTATAPASLASVFLEQIERGRELALVYCLPIADPGTAAPSYACDALPADVIKTDLPRIDAARRQFDSMAAPAP